MYLSSSLHALFIMLTLEALEKHLTIEFRLSVLRNNKGSLDVGASVFSDFLFAHLLLRFTLSSLLFFTRPRHSESHEMMKC